MPTISRSNLSGAAIVVLRKRLVWTACALTISLTPLAAQAAGMDSSRPKRSSDLAYGTESAIKVVRPDRLILGPATRICVETSLDPDVKRIIEASGQALYPRLVKEITYETTGRLRQEFRDRGLSHDTPPQRIVSHIDHELDPQGCFDRPDTIRVWQRIVRGKSPLGYGVRLEATQGARAYILAVERPYAVTAADETRGALDHRVTHIPGTQQPYWDPVRDLAVMADMFILHLLEVPT